MEYLLQTIRQKKTLSCFFVLGPLLLYPAASFSLFYLRFTKYRTPCSVVLSCRCFAKRLKKDGVIFREWSRAHTMIDRRAESHGEGRGEEEGRRTACRVCYSCAFVLQEKKQKEASFANLRCKVFPPPVASSWFLHIRLNRKKLA